MAVDQERLDAFLGKVLVDMSAAFGVATVLMGDKLGLWKELADAGPLTAGELAARTGIQERLAAEWLAAQTTADYVAHDPASGRFSLTEEQAAVFTDETSPAYFIGLSAIIGSIYADVPGLAAAYRGDGGFAWSAHSSDLFHGTERFFRPGYQANLLDAWLPALTGVREKLEAGGRAADVGCGHGITTLLMAQRFPKSRFFGFDNHDASIDRARELAKSAGVADRTDYAIAGAQDYPGGDYDLVCFFDCLHDMGDPVGALEHVRKTLAPGGSVLLVEPAAGAALEDNTGPLARIFYNASATICVPNALSQAGGHALGAQAGEARLREVAESAGFGTLRVATSTPVNLVIELRA